MWKQSFLKYRGLFISTTAFMLFFVLYLMANYAIQQSAVSDIQYASLMQNMSVQFQQSGKSETLGQNIRQLHTGGDFILSPSETLTLESLAEHLHSPTPLVDNLLSAWQADNRPQIEENLQMLLQKVEDKKQRSLKLLNALQIIVAILTVLLYFVVMIQIVLNLSKTDVVEVKSRQETEGIMNTISEGLFLLDKDYQIGSEQSSSLKGMFKSERDLEGQFLDFISQYVTQSNVELAQEYLQLLFGDRVKERLVEELNPLKQVEVNIVRRDGRYDNRYLDFTFKRVLENGKVSHLLGSVNDVTRQVTLEKELEATKEAQEAQLDMLKSILYIDKDKLSIFFSNTDKLLRSVNQTLEEQGKNFSDSEARAMLKTISSKIHQIKGDAATLGLHRFEFAAHEVESSIEAIQRDNDVISGKELLPFTTNLRAMFSDLDDMQELVSRFSGMQLVSHSADQRELASSADMSATEVDVETIEKPTSPSIDISASLEEFAQTVADRNKKSFRLITDGLDGDTVPETLVPAVQSMSTQLVRNSIVHGIETPEQRADVGKKDVAEITVSFTRSEKGYFLSVRDDGRGIDARDVLKRAIDQGVISQSKAEKMPLKQLPALLFFPGFSSRDEADTDAGRGMGLDVVKRLAEEHNGKIKVNYKKRAVLSIWSVIFQCLGFRG